jgi:translation elongation factor EF-Tu-like GTPase
MSEQLVGVVDHWYGDIDVAGVAVTGAKLGVGDTIHIVGHTTDLTTTIASMQIDRVTVVEAGPGDKVGIKVPVRARVGDQVFRVGAD